MQQKQAGFTLIEIMVVVVILGILASFAVPKFTGHAEQARELKAKQDIVTIEGALDMYQLDNFSYPSSDQGLDSLISQPGGEPEAPNWREGGYLKKVPKDPWGREYYYLSPGEHGAADIYSLGSDGQVGGEGKNSDIGNWNSD